MNQMHTLKRYKLPVILFFLVFLIYLSNLPWDLKRDVDNRLYRRMLPSSDVVPNTFLPYILIKEKSLDFKTIANTLRNFDDKTKAFPYFLIEKDNGYVSAYPIIAGLLATPIYVIPIAFNKIPELTYHENILKILVLGRISASFFASLSVLIFYFITERISKNSKWNIIFTLFYAFGTGTYSISSRGLWMHTTSQLIFSLILLLLLYAEKKGKHYNLIGFLLGLAVLNRPTSIVFALVIALHIFLHKKEYFIKFLIGALPTVIFLIVYNYHFFGSPFIEGYAARGADNKWTGNLAESIPGFLFSPARGFLFISPPLMLFIIGIYQKIKERDKLFTFLAAGLILSIIMMGKWYHWHGSNAFGSRMLVDYLPFIAIFSFISFIKSSKNAKLVILFLMFFSFYVHFNAVINRKSRCDADQNWTFYCLKWPSEPAQY